ncbi:hypothetical protein JXI42_13340, partial [bacterium]|nr:hypothetical protein [bacterium]
RVYPVGALTPNKVKFKIEYYLDSTRNFPFSVKPGIAIDSIADNHVSFVPLSSFNRSGLLRGDKSIEIDLKYEGSG